MQAHGRHEIERHGQILICRVYDEWNAEAALRFVADVKSLVAELKGRPWFRVVNMLNWKLGTPEVTRIMHEFLAWSEHNGGAGQVYVAPPNAPQRYQVQDSLKGLREPEFLQTEEEALDHARLILARLAESGQDGSADQHSARDPEQSSATPLRR